MSKIGKKAVGTPYVNVQYYNAHACDPNDCFILISYSGETESVIKTAKKLKERNIHTILITSYGGSTLADLVPVKLYMSTHENTVDSTGDYSAYLFPLL